MYWHQRLHGKNVWLQEVVLEEDSKYLQKKEPKNQTSGLEWSSIKTVGVEMIRTRISEMLRLIKNIFVEFLKSLVLRTTKGTSAFPGIPIMRRSRQMEVAKHRRYKGSRRSLGSSRPICSNSSVDWLLDIKAGSTCPDSSWKESRSGGGGRLEENIFTLSSYATSNLMTWKCNSVSQKDSSWSLENAIWSHRKTLLEAMLFHCNLFVQLEFLFLLILMTCLTFEPLDEEQLQFMSKNSKCQV